MWIILVTNPQTLPFLILGETNPPSKKLKIMIKLKTEKPQESPYTKGVFTQHCLIIAKIPGTSLQRTLKFFASCDENAKEEEIEISPSAAKEILNNLIVVEKEEKRYRVLK